MLEAAVASAPQPPVVEAPREPSRVASLDLVRGLVMALMVLDHARDFFFTSPVEPSDVLRAPPILFATRWITHFCAPAFVMLAGASAYLYGRKRTPSERRRFLFTRGLWLVLLEITVVRIGWTRDPTYGFTFLQVIWAIGWSMVILAPISSLPPRVLAAIGVSGIALHNLLDRFEGDRLDAPLRFAWSVMHEPSRFEPAPGHVLLVAYPLVPWVFVMALGFGVGALFTRPPELRQRVLGALGLLTSVAFVIVRGVNGYGNPRPWGEYPELVRTLMSFLACEKYPPSLDYLLMTLGPILIVLAALDRWSPPASLTRPIAVFGRVPLFFYVAHLYVLSAGSAALAYARWGSLAMDPDGHDGSPELPLWGTYLAWLVVLALLFPACRWFAGLKERRASEWPWLTYL